MHLAPMLAGVNRQTQQQKASSTQIVRSSSSYTTARQPLTSDVVSFSKSQPRFGSDSIGSVPDTALSNLAIEEAHPESSTSASSVLITHRQEISKTVKNILASGRITKGAQKQLLAASTFAETSTNPEELRMVHDELARFSKQLDLHKGGSKAGYIFKRPQITSPGENSMEHRQAALQGRLGTAVTLDRHDADFNVKYDQRYMELSMFITLIESFGKPVTKMNSEETEELIDIYKERIESLFGNILSKNERTAEENQQIKQGYRKPAVQQGFKKAVKNTEAIRDDAKEVFEDDLHGTLDMIKSGSSLKGNIQCVREATRRAEIPQQAKERLLNSYSNFMTMEQQLQGVDLDKLLKGNKAIPQRPTATALSDDHIAALMKIQKAKKELTHPETSTVSTEPAEMDQINQESTDKTKKPKVQSPEQKAKRNQAKYARAKRKKVEAKQAEAERAGLSQGE